MMDDALYKTLNDLRTEYRTKLNSATDKAMDAAAQENMEDLSMWSSEAARMGEAFMALNQAIKIVEDHSEEAAPCPSK